MPHGGPKELRRSPPHNSLRSIHAPRVTVPPLPRSDPRLLISIPHAMEATRSSILSFLLLCSALPGILSMKVISLQSIMIFTTHDWLPLEPTIFFRCQGDNMTILPDIKETNLLYTFKGVESWQSFRTRNASDVACMRETMKSDDAFDEWELCPDDFHNGTYAHFKEKEFNATFRAIFRESGRFWSCWQCERRSWQRHNQSTFKHSYNYNNKCIGFYSSCSRSRVWVQVLAEKKEGERSGTVSQDL